MSAQAEGERRQQKYEDFIEVHAHVMYDVAKAPPSFWAMPYFIRLSWTETLD